MSDPADSRALELGRQLLKQLGKAYPAFAPALSEPGATSFRTKIVIDERQEPRNYDFIQPFVASAVLALDSRAIHLSLDGDSVEPQVASIPWKAMKNGGIREIDGAGFVLVSIVWPFRIGIPPDPVFAYLNSDGPPLEGLDDNDEEHL